MMNGQNPSTDLGIPISVTLPLGVWQTMLSMIGKAPWEAANPIISELVRQLEQDLSLRQKKAADVAQVQPGGQNG